MAGKCTANGRSPKRRTEAGASAPGFRSERDERARCENPITHDRARRHRFFISGHVL